MLVYVFAQSDAAPVVWGRLIEVKANKATVRFTDGSISTWDLGHAANGYRGTFAVVCPD